MYEIKRKRECTQSRAGCTTTVRDYIKKDPDFSMRFLGDKSRLPEKLRQMCIEIENESKDRFLALEFFIYVF